MTGLAGHSAAYTHVVWVVASVFGLALLGGLAVLYRRARAAHELEEAERVLAEAFAEESPAPPTR
ncbi:MAG: hypothetical protein IPQ07_00140 [Myxococcales bacterium]|nr:hypothetical protein [Myxococcales bacterium]